MSKAEYVRAEAARNETFDHHCHWPGCERRVPPAMWGCKPHWFKLPAYLRARVWQTYRPGQEVTKDPSDAYLAVARLVQDWIAAQGMSAGTAKTPKAVEGEARQPGPPTADAPTPSHQESTPNDHK